ncbi:MAG TPA: F0F1 ATP synthase subunit A [Terracidiphilus sp.]|jgi:F-type H+-transporting ATPase subunit a|nr:F0F1 ATP synthase subunit A [Terracidiphilus sp.]
MPELFGLTHFVNSLLSGIELKLYATVGVTGAEAVHRAYKINAALALELLVAAFLLLFFLVVRSTLSVEKPNSVQQIAEMIHEGVGGLSDQIIGHGYERFQAFVTCILLFILLNNFWGLVPGIITPTSRPEVPLGIAVLTFLYYNFHGVRVQGPIGYLKHFAGPLWWLAPLMFPIEVVSHLARMMSLTIRLYANMFASDLLTLVWFSIIPLAVPAVFLGLHFAVSVIQAFVFMLLSMIYLSMAVAHEH